MKFIKEHSAFLVILLSCAILRFLPLFDYQFTFDELSGLDRTQFSSFPELIDKGVKIDAHPAFVQILIYWLTQIFGYVTWIVKLPFLLFSLGAVIYAYALGLRHFSKQAGLISAGIFSFSLIFVFYAPIARMYISGVFFSSALLYYFFEIFFGKKLSVSNFILFGLFALLSALNQHLNALFAFTVCASGLFFLDKSTTKKYLITCAVTVLLYLPHLSVTLYQLSVPGIGRENGGWLEMAEFSIVFDFFKVLFGTGKSYLLLICSIVLAMVLNRKFILTKKQILLLLLFIINYLIIYVYSVLRSPIYQHSAMLFSAVALVMALSSMIEFKQMFVFYSVLFGICSMLIYKSYFKKDYLHQAVKTVYEYQFERTLHYKNVYGEKNVFPVFCDADTLMQKIYFRKYQTKFDCKISADSLISNMESKTYERAGNSGLEKVSSQYLFSEFVRNLKSDYLILTSSTPLQQAIVKEYFPYLLENTQTQAINFKLYSKRKEDAGKVVEDDKITYYSDLSNRNAFNYSKAEGLKFSKNEFLLSLDSLNEFPFDAKADLNAVASLEGEVLLVTSTMKMKKPSSQTELCISVNDKTTNESYAYTAKSASDYCLQKDSTIRIYAEYFNGTKFKAIKDKASIAAYVWNKDKESLEMRSFDIKLIDYWHMKWHFWD